MSRALYKILVDDILRQISSGQMAVGTKFPPEAEYAETLGVSRSTLRQAFSRLEQGGFIKRRQRGGTEVISNKPVHSFDMVADSLQDVLSVARDTLLVVSDINEAPAGSIIELAEHDADAGSWLVCSGGRYMAGQKTPFAIGEIYIPKRYSDIDLQAGDTTGSTLIKLEERFSLKPGRVNRYVSADVCSDEVAEKLGLTAGDAVMVILAEIMSVDDDLIQIAHSIIDPARFKLTAEIVIADEF